MTTSEKHRAIRKIFALGRREFADFLNYTEEEWSEILDTFEELVGEV